MKALIFLLVALLLAQSSLAQNGNDTDNGLHRRFSTPGNLLIADTLNNRVIEVHRQTHQIVWSYGSGNSSLCDTAGNNSVIGPTFAMRLPDNNTLIVAAGILPGTSEDLPDGCPDSRVIVVDPAGSIIWSFGGQNNETDGGQNNQTNGGGQNATLDMPLTAVVLPNGNILIADAGNNRIIEVDRDTFQVVYSFPPEDTDGGNESLLTLNVPSSAMYTTSGAILIADTGNNRVLLVHRGVITNETDTDGNGTITAPTETASSSVSVTGTGVDTGTVSLTATETVVVTDTASVTETEVVSSTATESVSSSAPAGTQPDSLSADIDATANITENTILFSYTGNLSGPTFAANLPLLHTLVVDSGSHRVVLLGPANETAFEYITNTTDESNVSPLPSFAVLTATGELVITDQFNHRVVVVNLFKQIIFQYGITNEAGNDCNMLNSPYSTTVVGDYFSLTRPPLTFEAVEAV
jgi:hypothetical protein